MPSLKDIKRRIGSVKKTQQITRAMRMVAGAKLRRAQDAISAARPYAERLRGTLAEVARANRDAEHPLLQPRLKPRLVEVVVITSAHDVPAYVLIRHPIIVVVDPVRRVFVETPVSVIINVGMTVGLMPITGLPLPFLSYGGSFLLTMFIGIGIVARVATER